MGISKRKFDDLDEIPTLSDSDDIPDLDGEDSDLPERRAPQKTNKKRKKGKVAKDDEPEQAATWTSQGKDDGAFDPDFHFDDLDGGTLEAFDGWEVSADQRNGASAAKKLGNVDDIIRRRRLANGKAESADSAAGSDGDDTPEQGDDDDEEEGGDDGVDIGSAESTPDSDVGIEADLAATNGHASSEDEEDDEEEAVTAPMPDVGTFSDDENEENEDPNEVAKRDAFFAPEDKSSDPKALARAAASFQSMSLSRPILRGLTAVGFTSPTPIQSKSVPVALLGKDIVGGAVTGSGKTAAFLLPILERLLYRPKKVPTTRVGILLPTRELAVQCYNVAKKLAQFADISFALIVGGLSMREQEQTLKQRPDVVIATPGRFIDHMRNTASFAVENLEILVLDEADRMLEEGFADELDEVLKTIPRSRQTMLFSATMTQDVDKLIKVGMNRPVRLMVDAKQQTVSGLVQEFIRLRSAPSDDEQSTENRRLATLVHLCKTVYASQVIVFIPTKSLAHRVKILFALQGIQTAELHGSLSQEQRLSAITSFRDGKCTHLLATDLASRGLDIPRVETVINYSVPTTKETYLHRVGRTARAGRNGVACTLFSATKPSSDGSGGPKTSERALLRPILRLAKTQKAPMRTRTLPADIVEKVVKKIDGLQDEIDDIMKEEKEERLLAQTERDMTKSENMMDHEDEIMSRPRRTWFQSERDKKAAKNAGKEVRMGLAEGAEVSGKKDKKKLSGKDKKKLDARDIRKGGGGWKKRKDERMGKGVIAAAKKSKAAPKSKTAPKKQKKRHVKK